VQEPPALARGAGSLHRPIAAMKTLIIDNFDSFTFNLYQLIARVNGELPMVVRNNADWDSLRVQAFDNIVISPGPGTPERSEDFGICRRVIEESPLPMLCVCLGHQGLGHVHGARVSLAPEPVHGRLSSIYHNDAPLFAGIPQGAQVVRYHSLMLADLPESIEPIAWTADDIIMACQHRDRPLWGVQFHPESIGTEHGARLCENFRDLTRAYQQRSGHARAAALTPDISLTDSVVPMGQEQRRGVADADRATHAMRVRELSVYPDPEQVFVELFGSATNAFWLDSSRETQTSRFHFMGDASGPLSSVLRYDVRGRRLEISRGQRREVRNEDIFSYLVRELHERWIAPDPALPFDFACGYVGYFGYELKAECGGDDVHRAGTPDAWFVFADRVLAFDALERRLYLLGLVEKGDEARVEPWFDEVEARLASLVESPRVPGPGGAPIQFRLERERDAYLQDIHECLHQIRHGESYEICLTNRIHFESDIRPLNYYRTLRRSNPAPYAAFLNLGDFCITCSSPERFLRIDREGWAESKPIKGTAPRGRTAAEDEQLREGLRSSEKDRSENLMIVDLVRNDLGVVCEVGTVHVPGFMLVETYATVHQLVSTIRGQLRGDMTSVDCVRAAFPGGSMTGAPKIRTMQIIDALEQSARGVYSGAIGWLGMNGAADLNIVIRTAVFQPQRACIGVGGAIVALSDPDAEFEEILLKGRALMRAAAETSNTPYVPMEAYRPMPESLEQFRSHIDALDAKLVELLGERLDLCRRIAIYKRENGIPMMQSHRVEHVKQQCAALGRTRGLHEGFVTELYGLIIGEACRIEEGIIDG
jgi:para-aminobenzoate synthetase